MNASNTEVSKVRKSEGEGDLDDTGDGFACVIWFAMDVAAVHASLVTKRCITSFLRQPTAFES